MENEFTAKEKIAGAFMIFIVIVLAAAVMIIGRGRNWFKTSVTYYTTFNEGYNLQVDAPVKLFKADIGKVKEITPVENKVRVRLFILEDYAVRIRTDSIAKVESPTFIGSEYVSITPGSADSPLISEGGEIPAKERKSVSDILDEFEVEKTAKKFIRAIQDISEAAELLRDPQGPLFSAFQNLNRTTAHLEKIVRDVESGKGTIGGLLRSEALIEGIGHNLEVVGEIIENIRNTSEKAPLAMDQVQGNLATIETVGKGLAESVESIQTILAKINNSMDQLKIVVNNLKKGSDDVPEITQTAKEGIQEIREGMDKINRVFQSLQENFIIRQNLPAAPAGKNIDAGLRR